MYSCIIVTPTAPFHWHTWSSQHALILHQRCFVMMCFQAPVVSRHHKICFYCVCETLICHISFLCFHFSLLLRWIDFVRNKRQVRLNEKYHCRDIWMKQKYKRLRGQFTHISEKMCLNAFSHRPCFRFVSVCRWSAVFKQQCCYLPPQNWMELEVFVVWVIQQQKQFWRWSVRTLILR